MHSADRCGARAIGSRLLRDRLDSVVPAARLTVRLGERARALHALLEERVAHVRVAARAAAKVARRHECALLLGRRSEHGQDGVVRRAQGVARLRLCVLLDVGGDGDRDVRARIVGEDGLVAVCPDMDMGGRDASAAAAGSGSMCY